MVDLSWCTIGALLFHRDYIRRVVAVVATLTLYPFHRYRSGSTLACLSDSYLLHCVIATGLCPNCSVFSVGDQFLKVVDHGHVIEMNDEILCWRCRRDRAKRQRQPSVPSNIYTCHSVTVAWRRPITTFVLPQSYALRLLLAIAYEDWTRNDNHWSRNQGCVCSQDATRRGDRFSDL